MLIIIDSEEFYFKFESAVSHDVANLLFRVKSSKIVPKMQISTNG